MKGNNIKFFKYEKLIHLKISHFQESKHPRAEVVVTKHMRAWC